MGGRRSITLIFDSSTPHQTHPARLSRILSGLAYIGPLSLVVVALLPRTRFVMKHALTALVLHLLRFSWCGIIIGVWSARAAEGDSAQYPRIAADLGMLLLTGFPWFAGLDRDLLYLLSLPLGFTWILAVSGAVIAVTGHTVDYDALLHADWDDHPPEPVEGESRPEDERAYARELRERQLERIWSASLVAQSERRRLEKIEQVKADMQVVLLRLDYLNHLLSYGEISLSRFNAIHRELIAYLDALRRELTDLQLRRSDALTGGTRPVPPLSLTQQISPVRALTLAILDRGGIPIFTYGHFPLDESLITGMVSAFDSLSEEMFGSRVHKTQLAEGQVVHFARGRATIAFALFEDEPAPVQIGQLREFLEEFERTNEEQLDTLPLDPAHLTEAPVPFEFVRRLPPATESFPAAPASAPVPRAPTR